MRSRSTRFVTMTLLVVLLAGCGPATTTVRPTSTATPLPTDPETAVPPTLPPTPVPPPTETATSQAINAATAAQLGPAAVFEQPGAFIITVLFSPDSRYLITVERNGDVVIRDVMTWEEHSRFLAPFPLTSAALSPDGTMIATAGTEGSLAVWDWAGNELLSIPYSSTVFAAQFSPDGRYLAVAGESDQVTIVDIATGRPVANLVGDHHFVSHLVFSPNGRTLLVSYERPGNVIKAWDTTTWQETDSFTHVTERIDYHDLVFSPDGRYLVIASTQETIKVLDVATWQVVKELVGHTRGTYQVDFSADGAMLISACDDGTLRLWNAETGNNFKTIRGYGENIALDLSPDGAWIAFSGLEEGVQVWAVAPATTVRPPAPTPLPPRPAITVENVARLEQANVFDLPDSFVNTITFAKVGATSDDETMIIGDRNGELRLWEQGLWKYVAPARSTYAADDAAGIYYWGTLAASPDGRFLAQAYGDDGTVTIYDRATQEPSSFSYGVHVWAVAISPDGKLLAVGGLRNNVLIYDIQARQQVADLASDYEYIFNLVFSPDGRTLLVAYERPGNMMKTWDTTTWQETAIFTHVTERIDYHDVIFTPDGQQLVMATTEDVGIKFLDLATQQVVREFSGLYAPSQLALSPDGRLLASIGDELWIWDMETGTPIKKIPSGEAGAVAFSLDGTLLAFSVWGQGVQVWAVAR